MGTRWILGALLACAIGCGSDGSGGGSVDGGPTDSASTIDAQTADAPNEATVPMLPACSLVCDRVLDCAAMTCVGIDWRTARLAQGMCDATCSPQFNSDVMAAADCNAVMGIVAAAAPNLDTLCNAPPCVSACQQFAVCLKQECERYATQTNEAIATGCMGWCEDQSAGDILAVSCESLVDALVTNDPAFAASCNGSTGCAELSACETYATKTTGCVLDHCAGNAEAFETGIHDLLLEYCANADDCPSPEGIAIVNGSSVTCDDPPLDAAGPAAPFTAICAGTVGASAADLVAVCDTLIACGATFASADLCAVYLAADAAVTTKAACVDQSADCTEAFACL